MENIIYTISNYEKKIVIDTLHNTIECRNDNYYGDVYPIIKLSHNNNHVLKFNKTCISTCNVEFLIAAIECDNALFNAVYTYVSTRNAIRDIKEYNEFYALSRAGFYGLYNETPGALISMFRGLSHNSRRMFLLDHICYKHDAKMSGVISMSTYVGYNKFCIARCNNCNNAICKYCYADSLTNQRYNLKCKLIRLHVILTNIELTENDIPVIDADIFPFFRFESFGDLNNTLQFKNYNLIASVNAGVNFTIWTKNPGIIQKCIDNGLILANNLVIGLSSLYLNTPELDKARKYSFVRFLFTVYDDNYIKEHNIVINCGARHCIMCGICYKYLHEYNTGLYIINERKK